jgi:hypothetical protein
MTGDVVAPLAEPSLAGSRLQLREREREREQQLNCPDLLCTPHTSSRDVPRIEHGLLEPLREEDQTALSACQQKIRLLSSGQQLVLGAGPGCVERPWPSALGGAARRH